MIAGPAFVTPHAVRQLRERVAPELTYEQALGAIIRGLSDGVEAGRVRALPNGAGWRVRAKGAYPFRAVIVPGEPLPVVATILRSGS